jgi:hypothetical protein
MADPELAVRERDPRFPGGEWTGFFLQHWMPGRHTTDMNLRFADGQITGRGSDRVGPFTIDGEYETDTGKCAWTKKYIGKHSVAYRGVNDGRGIWGVWEIRILWGWYQDRGGFHIWPRGTDVSEASDRTEEAVLEVMRQEFGSPNVLIKLMIFIAVLAIAAAVFIPRFAAQN